MKISDLAQEWLSGLVAELITQPEAEKFIIEAAKEYQAWGFLRVEKAELNAAHEWTFQAAIIDGDTDLTVSEWGVIKPLATLLMELESAKIQESSRVASHEVYGRSVSEIQQAISLFREEHFCKWAFSMPVITV